MCKVMAILVAVLAAAQPCLGQSAFMDYGKSGYAIVMSGNYSTQSERYVSNTGALTLGGIISVGGRTDIEVGFSHIFSDKSANTGPFGMSVGNDPASEAFRIGAEVFIYKGFGIPAFGYSIGAGCICAEKLAIEGSPINVYIKTSNSKTGYIMFSNSLTFYDSDIEGTRSKDFGTAIGWQALLFARTSDTFAITCGPSIVLSDNLKSYAILIGLLFI